MKRSQARTPLAIFLFALSCFAQVCAVAETSTRERVDPEVVPYDAVVPEKYDAGWTFAFDDDVMSFADRDADYTGGMAVTFAGRRVAEWPLSLDRAASRLDFLVPRHEHLGLAQPLHAMQIGLIAFTPEDLDIREPIPDERPYASLLYLSNARVFVTDPEHPAYETSLTVGMLGLDLAGDLQRAIHTGLDVGETPRGWDNQISDGGEPTVRATWARQALLGSRYGDGGGGRELKWRVEGSVGYLTEASVALSARWGTINTPWWSSAPERADYVSQPAPIIGAPMRKGVRELYVWAGLKARVRAYNAFLQGQFRDSAVTVPYSRTEQLIGEAWLGVTWQVSRACRLSYVARYQTPEVEHGPGGRGLLWAGLMITNDL
jgi:hypothetical protein